MLSRGEVKAVIRLALRVIERRQKEQAGGRVLMMCPGPLADETRFAEFCETYALCEPAFVADSPPGWMERLGRVYARSEIAALFSDLAAFHSLILLSPPLPLLERLTLGDTAQAEEALIMDFALKQKSCALALDYDIGAMRPGRFKARLEKLLDDLADMGFHVIELSDALIDRDDEAVGLLTADLVDEFSRRGERVIVLGQDAIVTPYAAERAREIGIKISKE